MKAQIVLLLSALILTPSVIFGGFGGNGVTPVPITEGGLDKDALEIFDRRKAKGEAVSYPPFEDVSQARINQLKQFPPFKGKTNQQVITKVQQMRRALICVIDLISVDNRATGQSLQRLLRLRKICFGLTATDNNVGMSIFPDGKTEFGIEPINIFYDVCSDLPLTEPYLFELYVALSHESLHAEQRILQPNGRPDFNETVDLQCREVEAHQGEMTRIREMQRIVQHIKDNGTVPSDARGATASFGGAIVNAGATPTTVNKWLQKLANMKSQRGNILKFRKIYKEAGQAVLNGDLDAAAIKTKLYPFRSWIRIFRNNRDFRLINTAIFASAPTITGTAGSRTVTPASGEMKQIIAPGLEEQVIDVPGNKVISDAEFNADGTKLIFVEVDLDSGGGGIGVFDLDSETGALDPGSYTSCFTSDLFGNGGDLLVNQFESGSPFYFVAGGSGDIFRCLDNNGDGCPDALLAQGTLGQGPDHTVGWVQFRDQDTLIGYPEMEGTVPDCSQMFSTASRTGPGNDFIGGPPQPWKDEMNTAPAPAGLPFEGRNDLPCVGTPGESFQIHAIPSEGPSEMIGQGTFGWKGFARPDLSSPINGNDGLQIIDGSGAESPIFVCAPAPGPIPGIVENDPFGNRGSSGWIQIGTTSWPGEEVVPQSTTDPGGAWTSGPGQNANCFGETFFEFDGPGDPGGPPSNFFRFSSGDTLPPPGGPLLELEAVPGVRTCLDVSRENDLCGSYELVEGPGLDEVLFNFNKDGSFTVSLLSFGGPIEFTYVIVPSIPGLSASPVYSVRVSPIPDVLENPPVYTGPGGLEYVNALVLVDLDEHYPLFQFSLANSPFDLCEEPHWHNSFANGSFVYSLEFPLAGVEDPDPPECGFGIIPEVVPELFAVPLSAWEDFKSAARP
ncbi:MAG: hypothetical protein ACSHYF_05790 [Verrucomicrobiaceae bacterium]